MQRGALILLAVVVLAAPAHAHDWTVEPVADNVYAALQPHDARFNDSNSLIVVGADAVVLVDTQENGEAVDDLLDRIAELTDKPIRYVINTHWHADHIGGNDRVRARFPHAVFLGATTMAQDVPVRARALVDERLERYATVIPQAEEQLALGNRLDGSPLSDEEKGLQEQAIQTAKDWVTSHQDLAFLPPTLAHDGGLRLHLGNLTLELLAFRGHTRGDTVVHVLEAGILATGDLMDDLPYVGHGYPTPWVAALDQLAAREFTRIVPGHGPVFEGTQQILAVKGFLEGVLAVAREMGAAGTSIEEAAAQAVEAASLRRWREALAGDDAAAQRFFDGTVGEAVQRAMEEAAGTLQD